MDFLTIISVILGVPSFICSLLDRVNFFRETRYSLTNKKFKTKITATKKYPTFHPNTRQIKKIFETKFQKNNKIIENQIIGSNYIQILIKNLQAPYFLKITPEPDPNDPERIIITINLLGTVDFRYRETSLNQYLTNIDEFFEIIEKEYHIHPTYQNYNLISTITDFQEENHHKQVKEENSIINIGKHVLNIHSTSSTQLYNTNKKYLAHIST